jgi:hypothetical protein
MAGVVLAHSLGGTRHEELTALVKADRTQDVIVMVWGADAWPPTVTVIVAVPGWSG